MDKSALEILIAEDNDSDAELIIRELRRAGFSFEWRRVQTEADFLSSLNSNIDIILSDYSMPQFNGLRALELAKKQQPQIPFILVSGTIGEEIAVAAMRDGATDYLLKDRLARLGAAVRSALDEKTIRDENRRAQTTIEKLRRDYELILNSADEGICGIDLDGKISFANPKAGDLLGWTPSELLGKPLATILHQTENKGAAEKAGIFDSLIHAGTRRVTNDLFKRKSDVSFRVDYTCAPIKDPKGQISGTILIFRDSSERFVADLRMKLQEQQYRMLFETNPNPMWVFDIKTVAMLAVNDAAIAHYGYSRDEFLKLTVKDLRPPDDAHDIVTAVSSPHAPAHFSGEFRHVKKDGSIIFADVYSSPVVWETGPARIVTAIDITERKQAEQRLLQQADIINRAQDAVIIRNFDDDSIIFWNAGAERIYGWKADEAVGRKAGELILSESVDREPILQQLAARGEYHGELKHRARDGRELFVDARVTLIRDNAGAPQTVLGINTDITEHKKLEMQLLRAQRLESIGTLAGGVAHDLNNILTPILMCAQTLHRELDEEDRHSTVGLIEQSARRGASIVKQVLTFARGLEGERVLIKPTHLIEEMVDIARRTFPKLIEIRGGYPEDLWSIEGDPTQLHQVLLNLCVNARDAMAEGGSLLISAENSSVDEKRALTMPGAKSGSYVAVSVADTGHGMSSETIEKIFDPFFTTKEVGKGTGLGLSTTVGIVKSHGGFIYVQSEVGKGTTFKIFLPAKVDEAARAAFDSITDDRKGNGQTVLIVDDEEPILQVVRMALEQSNYCVLAAHDGPEALAIFGRQMNSIAAILTDIQLPRMDGASLIRTMKKMKPNIITVACTGFDEIALEPQLRGLGVDRLLTKPYDTQMLLATLHDAFAAPPS